MDALAQRLQAETDLPRRDRSTALVIFEELQRPTPISGGLFGLYGGVDFNHSIVSSLWYNSHKGGRDHDASDDSDNRT